jgi:hypothetical protein
MRCRNLDRAAHASEAQNRRQFSRKFDSIEEGGGGMEFEAIVVAGFLLTCIRFLGMSARLRLVTPFQHTVSDTPRINRAAARTDQTTTFETRRMNMDVDNLEELMPGIVKQFRKN